MPRKPTTATKADSSAAKRKTACKPKDAPTVKVKPEDYKDGQEHVEEILRRYRGRPTKYDPAYCDMVILWGKLGKSRTWMAAELMVVRNTLDNWAEENPEFLSALTLAKHLEQQYWEDKGDANLTQNGFAQNCWGRNMAARFPKDWQEKKAVDHGISSDLASLLGMIDGDDSSIV